MKYSTSLQPGFLVPIPEMEKPDYEINEMNNMNVPPPEYYDYQKYMASLPPKIKCAGDWSNMPETVEEGKDFITKKQVKINTTWYNIDEFPFTEHKPNEEERIVAYPLKEIPLIDRVQSYDKDYDSFKESFLAYSDRLLRDKGIASYDLNECLKLAFDDIKEDWEIKRLTALDKNIKKQMSITSAYPLPLKQEEEWFNMTIYKVINDEPPYHMGQLFHVQNKKNQEYFNGRPETFEKQNRPIDTEQEQNKSDMKEKECWLSAGEQFEYVGKYKSDHWQHGKIYTAIKVVIYSPDDIEVSTTGISPAGTSPSCQLSECAPVQPKESKESEQDELWREAWEIFEEMGGKRNYKISKLKQLFTIKKISHEQRSD